MTERRKATAYHEAAHAVIGRVLCLTCGRASIRPNPAENEAGHAIIADPWKTAANWDAALWERIERGEHVKSHSDRSAFRATIMARMAGAEAEWVFFNDASRGDGDDRHQIELMAQSRYAGFLEGQWERYEPRTRRQVRRLIRKHRFSIDRIAHALLKFGALAVAEIDWLRTREHYKNNTVDGLVDTGPRGLPSNDMDSLDQIVSDLIALASLDVDKIDGLVDLHLIATQREKRPKEREALAIAYWRKAPRSALSDAIRDRIFR